MDNLRQNKQLHRQFSLWLIPVLIIIAAAFFKGSFNVQAKEEEATLTKQYVYIDNKKDLTLIDDTKAGQKYKLGIKVKSTDANPQLKYEWYMFSDSQEEKKLSYTTSEITITKGKCREEHYRVEVTDRNGNCIMNTFDLYREDILKAKLYINDVSYVEGKIFAVESGERPTLKVQTETLSKNTRYSWQKDGGDETVLSTQGSYKVKEVTETDESYTCNVESDGYKKSYVFKVGIESIWSMDPTIEVYVNGTKTKLLQDGFTDAYAKKGDTVKLVTKITSKKYTSDQVNYKWYDEDGKLLSGESENPNTYIFTKSGSLQEYYKCKISLKSNPEEEDGISISIGLDSGIRGTSFINGKKTETGEVTVKSYDDLKNIKFRVEATGDNPIKSYQWYMLDKLEDDMFLADGQEYILPKEIAENEDFEGIGCKVTDVEENSKWFYFFVDLEDDELVNPEEPSKKPTQTNGNNSDQHSKVNKALKVGTKITNKKTEAVYKVTGKNTIEYVKPFSKNITTVTISATITINKVKYKVTSIASKAMKGNKKLKKVVIPSNIKKIGAQAFSGCKNLKNITIKTTKLTSKTVGAKAFKGISAKAVIKVPKKQLKAYQKLLKAKGAGKTVKIKK